MRRPAAHRAGSLARMSRPPEITRTECRQCGTEIYGVNGRYPCTVCGWVNPWYEGHGELPTAKDDPDYPRRRNAR